MNTIKCEICGREFSDLKSLSIHISKAHNSIQNYYDKYIKQSNEGICKFCGKPTKFHGLRKGYARYCSTSCVNLDPDTQSKIKNTCLDRYGVDHPNKSKEIRKKTVKTCIERYGVDNPNKSKEIREKTKKTNLKRYGVENVYQSEEIKEKIKETHLKKRGVEYPAQSKEVQEKMKQTKFERYGDEYYTNREKSRNTLLTNYGAEYTTQIKEIKEKIEQTNLKRYGVKYLFQNGEIREKIKETWLEKYGVDNPWKAEEIKEKIEQTNLERYGVKHITDLEWVSNLGVEAARTIEVRQRARNTIRENNCYGVSAPEERTFEKLIEIFGNVEREYKEDRYTYFCDFYIPERDMFIEYNGFWTHHTHFYDETSEEDRNQVKLWESKEENSSWYRAAINNWTISDIKKRNTARDNNLNYVVFWNENDVDKWIADGCPDRQDWR